jgi:sugar phosphate isomerase/epimerase
MTTHPNTFPKLHNAMWPGLVGKGSPGGEPCLDLDTMLDLTAKAEVEGVKFDGVDIFLFEPHINIDIGEDDLKRTADKILAKGLVVGSVVAPIWPPTGGGSAMGNAEERQKFVGQVRKGCRIAALLRKMGARPYGVVRVDTACSVTDWDKDPEGSTQLIAQTLREACDVAESFGERLAAEGEICCGSLQSWKEAIKLLELVGRPKTLGFQADMAHTLLYLLGYNKPEDALLPPDWNWSDPAAFDAAYKKLTDALRPWTIDFHIAQNDATVKGSGSHDKTGKHCMATDPQGKLDVPRHAGFWMRDEAGRVTKAFKTVCWDGCMFPNEVMMKQQTWNDILATMIRVREAHGWHEPTVAEKLTAAVIKVAQPAPQRAARPAPKKAPKKPVAKKPAKTAAKAVKTATKKAVKKVGKKAAAPKAKKTLKPKTKAPAKKTLKQGQKKAPARKKK